jgi:hypothetical protein
MSNPLRDHSCLSFEVELEAYLEGENRPALTAHAQRCEFCRCILEDLDQLRTASAGLALEEPPAALWSNIRSALIADGTIRVRNGSRSRTAIRGLMKTFWRPIPVGAFAAAVVALVVLLWTPGYLTRPHYELLPRPAEAQVSYMAPADLAQLTQTIRQLERTYRVNEPFLEPSMKATYEKSLESLDSEIRECQDSMKGEADTSLAKEYLSTAYVQKAQLLQSALEYSLRQ